MDARCHTVLCSLCSRFTCALALHSLCHMAHKVLAGAAVWNWGRALWWDSKHSERRFSQGLTLGSRPSSLNPANSQLTLHTKKKKRARKSSIQIIVLQQLESRCYDLENQSSRCKQYWCASNLCWYWNSANHPGWTASEQSVAQRNVVLLWSQQDEAAQSVRGGSQQWTPPAPLSHCYRWK